MPETEQGLAALVAAVREFCRAHPKLATGKGSFSRCRNVSAMLVARLAGLGFDPAAVRLSECTARFPDADLRWRRLGGEFWWVHYAVRVGDVIIDCTARQFDPNASFPSIVPLEQVTAIWEDACEVDILTGARIRSLRPGAPAP